MTTTVTSHSFGASDGFQLSASVFTPTRASGDVVLVNSATAVPQGFYRRFAAFLAEAGYLTVTYDYRGIGESRPASLRGFRAAVRDWALLDMDGALEWIRDRYAPTRLFTVGHSVGGQVTGLLDHPERIDGMVTMSSQSGYWRLQGGFQKPMVGLHVHVTLPLLAHLFGYAPWSRISKAEDLPRDVALEWSRWCRDRRYLLGDATLPLERFGRFAAPVLAYSFDDDDWGTVRAVDAMMEAYPNVERRHRTPADLGMSSIGHMGAFRAEAVTLWREVVAWFEVIR